MLFVQGGGLAIFGGNVMLDSCEIYNNAASRVSHQKSKHFSQRPHGKSFVAHLLSVLFVRSG